MRRWLNAGAGINTQPNINQPASLGNDYPGTFIGNRENSIIWTIADLEGIFAEPVGNLQRNEYEFVLPADFRFLKDQLAVQKVIQSEFQDLANSNASPDHQLQHQPIPGFRGSKNDFIDSLFFEDFPLRDDLFSILFPDHWRIVWIMQTVIQVVTDEIKEEKNVGIADALGVRLVALGETIQEPQDIIRCYLIDLESTEFKRKTDQSLACMIGPCFLLEWALW